MCFLSRTPANRWSNFSLGISILDISLFLAERISKSQGFRPADKYQETAFIGTSQCEIFYTEISLWYKNSISSNRLPLKYKILTLKIE